MQSNISVLQEKAVVNVNGGGADEQVSDNSCVLNSADMKETLDWFGDITYQKSIAKDDEVEVSNSRNTNWLIV